MTTEAIIYTILAGAAAAYAITWAAKAIVNHHWPTDIPGRRWVWRPVAVLIGITAGILAGPSLGTGGWVGAAFGGLGGTMTTAVVAAMKARLAGFGGE